MSFNWEHYYTKGNTEVPMSATFLCFSLTSDSKCCTFPVASRRLNVKFQPFLCHCDRIGCCLAVDVSGYRWFATRSDISPKPLHVGQKNEVATFLSFILSGSCDGPAGFLLNSSRLHLIWLSTNEPCVCL